MLKPALNAGILAALLLCLVTASVSFGGILLEYALPLYCLAGGLVLLAALKLLLCRDASWVWSPMHGAVLLFVAYTAWRYAGSPIEYESRLELFHVGLFAVVYFVVAGNLSGSRDREAVLAALVVLAAAESVYALWQYRAKVDVVLWLDRGAYHGRGSGTYFCPNHLAGLLNIALGMLAARLLIHRGQERTLESALIHKLYEATAAVFIALGLLATLSRGGWIAMAAAVVALLLWAELTRVLSSRFVIAVFVSFLLVGAAAWSVPRVRDRVQQDIRMQLSDVPGDSPIQVVAGISGRYPMWRATLRMIRDHPWLGTGPGTWEWFHLKYREPRLQIHPRYTHNDVLQLASDYGLVGVALVLGVWGCFFWQAARISRHGPTTEQRAFAVGAVTASAAILVHSFGDFNLHVPANALWLATLMGLTVALPVDDRARPLRLFNRPSRFLVGGALLALLAWGGWVGVRLSLGDRCSAKADEANQQSEWDEALQWGTRALRYDARNPRPHALIGDAYRMQSAMAYDPQNPTERRRLAELSVQAYRRSLALNPFQSDVMLRLAAAYELAGDNDHAARTYDEALAVDPNNAFTWLRIGMFYRRRGDLARAVEAFKLSQQLNRAEPIAQQYLEEIARESAGPP
jgi:O-antigen ligase